MNYKGYVCEAPFKLAEIHEGGDMAFCCLSWLPLRLSGSSLRDMWYSEEAKDLRQSILNGTYDYCNEKVCPYLVSIREGREPYKGNPNLTVTPDLKSVRFCFDRSCNLNCTSCRDNKFNGTGEYRDQVDNILQQVENDFGKTIETFECEGSGDPFFSKSFRNWMINFDPKKYPNLKSVRIITNGQLFTKKFWEEDLSLIRPYIKDLNISIDAAYKDTYEKVRRGGKWEKLVENLEFISTLPLDTFMGSFVVQKLNYREVEAFYSFIEHYFNRPNIKSWWVSYGKALKWDYVSNENYHTGVELNDEEYQVAQKQIESLIRNHGTRLVQANI